jgi:hypothetical protein
MNEAQKKQLLEIARDTIQAVIMRVPVGKPRSEDPPVADAL